jgi:HEAT repeat protein
MIIQMNENGKKLEELVEHLLDDDNKWKRVSAARALGGLKDTRAVKALIEALGDYDLDVGWAAVKALSRTGEHAVEPLIQALKDKDSWVRKGAATVLGMLGTLQAIEPLIQALKDKDSWVRWRAAEALGKIRDIKAIKPLEHLLQVEKREKVIEAVEKALEQLQ